VARRVLRYYQAERDHDGDDGRDAKTVPHQGVRATGVMPMLLVYIRM
jgi:hypothetical protein